MKNRVIALALTLAMAGSAAAANFSDVQGNWAQSDINAMSDMNVMTGVNGTTMFQPDAWLTRSDFAQMTLKTLDMPKSKLSTLKGVNQVYKNQWGFNDFTDQTLIGEYPAGVYRPANPVRRVEVMAALGGSINKPLVSEVEADRILSAYSDAGEIPANARREVATALKYDLFENNPAYGNELRPMEPATRADVAASLHNFYENREIAMGYTPGVAQATPPMQTTGTAAAINLPAGETLTGTVAKAFFSELNRPGDPVVLILDHALMAADGTVLAPAGSKLNGEITRVLSHNRNRKGEMAEVAIQFNELVTPAGEHRAVNASIASPTGVLRADQLQGIVIHPDRSLEALRNEYRAAQGGWMGTKLGKQWVLGEPQARIGSDQMVTGDVSFRPSQEVLVGVGDRLHIRIDSVGTVHPATPLEGD